MSAKPGHRRSGAIAAISQSLVANLIIALGNMAVGILTARHLGPVGRGELAALVTLPTFLPYFMTLGVPSATIFETRRDPASEGALMGACLGFGAAAAATSIVIALCLSPLVLGALSSDSSMAAPWLMFATGPNVLITYLMAGLQSRGEFIYFNRIRYSQPLTVFVVVLLLDAIGRLTPVSAAIAILFAGLPGTVWCLYWVVRHCAPTLRDWKASAAQLLPYGLRSYSADLVVGFATQIDKLIVVAILAPATLGLFVVATNLSRTVLLLAQAVTPVLFPRASGLSEAEVIEITSKATAVTALFVGVAAAFLMVAGPSVLELLYGKEFVVAALAFRLLVLEACLSSLIQVMSQAFMALNRPILVTLQYGLGGVTAVGLLLVLTPRFGAGGAAAALLLAACVRLATTYASFEKGMNVPAPRIWRGWRSSLELIRVIVDRLLHTKSTPANLS